MATDNMDQAIEAFVAERNSGQAMARISQSLAPGDVGQGYALQNQISERLQADKGPRCGHKIGCTTPVMQEFLNINHPCAGRLYEREVYSGSVTLRLDDFVGVGVECEIALRLSKDLGPSDQPYTRASVAGAVGEVMAACELVDNRYLDFHDFGIPSLIADDFFSAGAVLGAPISSLQNIDLSAAKGTTLIDGVEAGAGLGAAVMGHPFNALAWLANQKSERGESLKAGDVIMTGSVVATQWIDKPCVVSCIVEPLGEVRLTFV